MYVKLAIKNKTICY